ncbi:hypothetical protein NLI96_g7636 [Meripilus lineatus]|uniref:Uncharacterized protein n=1 Tax=Meripilus lineatus TaxID=2056292 RepID=A0AAD5YH05_9APHY|nr:hypothetical protein NLI96_g7636 [Physisporinus lineatus]
MSQNTSTTSSRSSSTKKGISPEQIIALPSLSCALSALPQAKSVDSVALHPASMSAQRAAESEAKLRKALSKNAGSNVPITYAPPAQSYSPGSGSPPLMMRKPLKTKMQV